MRITMVLLLFSVIQVMAESSNVNTAERVDVARDRQAQELVVTGTVTDEDGELLPGVNILIKGTQLGTISDVNGHYSIKVDDPNAILVFSYIAYRSQEISVGSQTIIDIVLAPDITALEEIIIVGYGTQKKVNLTGAVSEVKGELLSQKTATGTMEALQGMLAGTTITRSSGAPGEENYQIQIRGITSVNNEPVLVLVNGIQGSIENVRPEDIESVTVLKDAAAAAIYGSKAAGGVILVTTKGGQQGRLTVDVNSFYSISKLARLPERIPSWQNAEMLNTAWTNAGLNIRFSDEYIAKFKDPNIIYEIDPANDNRWLYFGDFDYRELTMKDYGSMQSHNVSLSGGDENTVFRLSGTFYKNDGIIKIGHDSNERYSGNATMKNKIGKYITLSNIVSYSRNVIDKPAGRGLESRWGFIESMINHIGTSPMRDPNGNWTRDRKVYQWSDEAGQRQEDQNNLRINSTLAIKDWIEGLQFRLVAGMDANFNNTMIYNNPIYVYGVDNTQIGTVNKNDIYKKSQTSRYREFQFLTDYDIEISKHEFHILGGYSISDYRSGFFSGKAFNKINPNLQDFDWSSNLGTQLSDRVSTSANQSVFGRLNYYFDKRYLFEANVRYDGSSKLSPENRYQLFPSVSAGWRIDQENWFNIDKVSQFKLRASWGQLGNEGVLSDYSYIGLLSINDNLILNDGVSRTQYSYQGALASESITWETVETSNIGMDLAFFDNNLLITGDYFVKNNKDMLAFVAYPSVIGVNVPLLNAGELKTWGWEANISWRDNISKTFNYWINANVADAQNELIEYIGADIFAAGTVRLLNGYPMNSIFGYLTDGLFQSEEEVAEHAFQHNRTGVGDVKYLDVNEDGVISPGDQSQEDKGDLVYLGNTNPRYTFGVQGGFNWKNFDFSFFVQGVGKRSVSLDVPAYPQYYQARIYHAGYMDYWTEDNRDAYWPRLYRNGGHNFRPSDRYIQNASYVRIKDIQLGFSMPNRLLRKVGIQNARVYLAGKDIWEFSKILDYLDPEIPDKTVGQYPFSRRYTIGINLTF